MESIPEDDGFKVPSSDATMAIKIARGVSTFSRNNEEFVHSFSERLLMYMDKCFTKKGSMHLKREKMWKEYHEMRISLEFKRQWETFLVKAGEAALPAFYQFVSHEFFKQVVKCKFQFEQKESCRSTRMSMENQNALRYVAGHVCRKVQHQISKSNATDRDDMILFIIDLSGDEESEESGTEKWLNAIDRGGLWHVNDDTYAIFCIMEEECQRHYDVEHAQHIHAGARKILRDKIVRNEDLQFLWSILSSRVDEEVGMTVLDMIMNLYVTIRGFAFASSCLELYKKAHGRKLQKSKALRRDIQQGASKKGDSNEPSSFEAEESDISYRHSW